MAFFKAKNPIIGKCKGHLVHFVVIWYIFSRFDMLYQEKSGNNRDTGQCVIETG
jgi:hypothetical protein